MTNFINIAALEVDVIVTMVSVYIGKRTN